MTNFETCAGCGQLAAQHPITMICGPADANGVAPLATSKDGKFVAVGVCDACWRTPEHRVLPLKGHFFEDRAHAITDAVFLAGERDASGNSVRS